MSKVAVVYWSSTGNTEAMANAVADGVKGKGGEAVLHTCEDFDGSKVTEYDAIAFGCPAMGDEAQINTESTADTESIENADAIKVSEITTSTESAENTEVVKDAVMPEILEPANSKSSSESEPDISGINTPEIELPEICSDIDFGDIDEPDNIVFPEFDYVVEPEIPDPSELPPIESNVISIFDEDWDDDDN